MHDPSTLGLVFEENEIIPVQALALVLGKHRNTWQSWVKLKRLPLVASKVFGSRFTTVAHANEFLKSMNLIDEDLSYEDFIEAV